MNTEKLLELLDECRLQLEYLNSKFSGTGTTNQLLSRVWTALEEESNRKTYTKVSNKLRVLHYLQIPSMPFTVDVKDEREAYTVMEALADQHLFLLANDLIEDYSNAVMVVMWDDDSDGNGNGDWVDYYNNAEEMDFDELVKTYFSN